MPIGPLSGKACVEALVQAGFERLENTVGFTVLRRTTGRDIRWVLVPEAFMLGPDILEMLLRTAGVSTDSFARLLASPREPVPPP
jgi:hypothetical protein